MSSGKPKIACFMCNWVFCDEKELALNQEHEVPFDVNIVRVMCIGRIDPVVVLEAFESGIDGILLIGCTPPDCHFVEGNLYAEKIVSLLKKLLALSGLHPKRLELRWSSPIEEVRFMHILNDFAAQIQEIGASTLAGERLDEKTLLNVSAAKNSVADFRLRVLKGRERELTENTNVYGEEISQEEFNSLMDEVIEAEFVRNKIRLLTERKPLSIKELAAVLDMKPALVLRHVVEMRRNGKIALDHIEETTPVYKALEMQ